MALNPLPEGIPEARRRVYEFLLPLCGTKKILKDESGEDLVFTLHNKDRLELEMRYYEPKEEDGILWHTVASIYWGLGYYTILYLADDLVTYRYEHF